MTPLRFTLVLLCLGSLALRAQDHPLQLEPPLREVFPLEAAPTGVHVKYPVLLSDHFILRPSAILHFIYLDPEISSHHHTQGPATFPKPGSAREPNIDDKGPGGGWSRTGGDEDAGIFDDSGKADTKQRKAELQAEVWTRPELFHEALDHAGEEGTTIVYNLPAQKRAQTALLDLPEGMFLAEVEGHVRVLGLTQESRAFAGGLRAGDEILTLNGGAPIRTLEDFVREFAATKHQAKVSGNSSYAMDVVQNGQPATIRIAAPPSIPSFF